VFYETIYIIFAIVSAVYLGGQIDLTFLEEDAFEDGDGLSLLTDTKVAENSRIDQSDGGESDEKRTINNRGVDAKGLGAATPASP
jgi:hypothetical protein